MKTAGGGSLLGPVTFNRSARWGKPLKLAIVLAAASLSCAVNPVSGQRQLVFMSEDQEKVIDEQAASQVAQQIGLVDDPVLTAYVNEIGQALAKHSPRQGVRYRFHVVAMDEPNAFALPAGHIYVSRGLLLLLNDESELANVLGHEIGHVAARHAAQRDALMKVMTVLNTAGMIGASVGGARNNGNGGPLGNPGLHGFSRQQESEADEIGQNLAVATGIDPAGMARLLRSLDASERMERGFSRETGYFDTHPAARERAAEAATAAEVRRFDPHFSVAESRQEFLNQMTGLSVGPPASEGVVQGERFLHPDLDFSVRFPSGWEVVNTRPAVYALSPSRDAVLTLELHGEGDDPAAAAHAWAGEAAAIGPDAGPVRIGGREAYRVRGRLPTLAGPNWAEVYWISDRGMIYRLSGVVLRGDIERHAGPFRTFPRSFRSLSAEERETISETQIQIFESLPGETLESLSLRTGNAWDPIETAVHNGIRPGEPLTPGQLVKVAIRIPYPSPERPPQGDLEREGAAEGPGNGKKTKRGAAPSLEVGGSG